ncbi:MAG: iron ABC transporter permease [Desulfosporosinus sp.]|nr:iron ABC transporter permease [Desulfosporosinus sp.]
MELVKEKVVYQGIVARKYSYLLMFAALGLVSLLVDVLVGPAWLSVPDVIKTIFGVGTVEATTEVIVWTLRLPTALMAIVVGATLGIAGAEMQTILDNPLASPYTLGISSGAGFGAALAMVIGGGKLPIPEAYLVPSSAFVFALLTCLLIYFIGRARAMTAETMVLAGIGLMFLFHALLALLQYMASPEALQAIVFWLFGSLMKATWPKVGLVSAVLVLAIPMIVKDAWKLTALKLGDEKAKSLGINVERLRLKTFVLISLLTASAVCFVGTIGFIGLVGPHIARMIVGEDQRFFLPLSALGEPYCCRLLRLAVS